MEHRKRRRNRYRQAAQPRSFSNATEIENVPQATQQTEMVNVLRQIEMGKNEIRSSMTDNVLQPRR